MRPRSSMGTYYLPGAHAKICDRTGFKVKSTQTKKEWNGLVVRRASYEPRQPQDLLRAVEDNQAVPDPRTEGENTFIGINERLNDFRDPDPSSVSATANADGGNTGDGSVTDLSADLTADTSGNYTLKITETTRDAEDDQDPGDNGEFRLADPNGDIVGFGEIGVAFTGGGLSFTVKEDGSTNFAVGDFFTISVS